METLVALLSNLYPDFISGPQGYMLLAFRAVVGFLFILHGLPKLKNLETWSNALGAPLPLCFLSAGFMIAGGVGLIYVRGRARHQAVAEAPLSAEEEARLKDILKS